MISPRIKILAVLPFQAFISLWLCVSVVDFLAKGSTES